GSSGRVADRGLERLADFPDRSADDVTFGQWEPAGAVGEHRHLSGTDLVTIEAWRLLADGRRGRSRSRRCKLARYHCGCRGATRKHDAASGVDHGVLPKVP